MGKGSDYIEIPLTVEQAAKLGLKIKDSTDIGPATALALGLQLPSYDLETPAESETQAGVAESSSTTKSEDPPALEQATTPTEEKPAEETDEAAIEVPRPTVEDSKIGSKWEKQPLTENENEAESPNIDESASDFRSVQDGDFSWTVIHMMMTKPMMTKRSRLMRCEVKQWGRWFALATVGLRTNLSQGSGCIHRRRACR